MRKHTTPDVSLVVLDEDVAVLDYANEMFAHDEPIGVVSAHYSTIMPFMLGNNGHTVALVADVDDTDQLAEAIVTVEKRLGHVSSVIRYQADLPSSARTTPEHFAPTAA